MCSSFFIIVVSVAIVQVDVVVGRTKVCYFLIEYSTWQCLLVDAATVLAVVLDASVVLQEVVDVLVVLLHMLGNMFHY